MGLQKVRRNLVAEQQQNIPLYIHIWVAQMGKHLPKMRVGKILWVGKILGLGRSSGEENGNPLQYSCLENPMDGGAW